MHIYDNDEIKTFVKTKSPRLKYQSSSRLICHAKFEMKLKNEYQKYLFPTYLPNFDTY